MTDSILPLDPMGNSNPVDTQQPILPIPSALPAQQDQNAADQSDQPAPGSFGQKFYDAANKLGVAPGPGGWAKSLVAANVEALNPTPQSAPAPAPTGWRAAVAKGLPGVINNIGNSLGDVAAVGTVPAGGGALTGIARTMAAHGERVAAEDTHAHLMAESNARMIHEQKLTHQLDNQAIQSSVDAGQKAVAVLKSAASPGQIIKEGLTSDELKQYLAANKIDPTKETAFPTGRKQVGENPDGTPMYRTTYTAMSVPQDVALDPTNDTDKKVIDRLNQYSPPSPGKQWQGDSNGIIHLNGAQFNSLSQQASDKEAATRARNKTLIDNDIADKQQLQKLEVVNIGPEWNNALADAKNDPFKALDAMQANPAARTKYPNLAEDVRQAYGATLWDDLVKERAKAQVDATKDKLAKGPKTINEAQSLLTTSTIAARNNPTPENQQAVKDAHQYLDGLRSADISQKYNDAQQRVKATRDADTDDLKIVAKELVKPDNMTALKDIASMRGDMRLRLYAEAKKVDPNFQSSTVDRKIRFLGQFTNPNGRVMSNIASGNTFLEHAGDLHDVNQGFSLQNEKILRTPLTEIEGAFGSTAYTELLAAINPVREEYQNALAAGFAPQAQDKEAGDTLLNMRSTPAQIETAARQMSHTLLRRMDSNNQEYRTVMVGNYPDLITPDAREAVGKFGDSELLKMIDKYNTGGVVGDQSQTGARQASPKKQAAPKLPANAQVSPNGVLYTTDGGKTFYETATGKLHTGGR